MGVENSNFIKACYGKNDGQIPVWVMRQAGRYLPDYRAVRKKVSFLELCRTPDLIAEVVRQPVEKFGLDAAILFSDILTILEPLGAPVTFPEGGPHIETPIAGPDDVDRLADFDVDKELSFVAEGIKKIKAILPDTPLIGFAGSPFTVACYLIEGQGSKNFDKAKAFLHRYPAASWQLINLVTEVTTRYLAMQVKAGADAVQIFDSWGGILSKEDYKEWSARPVNSIFEHIEELSVPRILFVNNLAPYTDIVGRIACEVIGVDYRMDLVQAAEAMPDKAVQGNLDPSVLHGAPEHVVEETQRILDSVKDHNRLIFNLGHGIQPKTPVESVEALVETVHNYR